MNWSELSEKLLLEVLFNFSLVVLAIWLLAGRPRKPKAIYAYFNRSVLLAVVVPIASSLFAVYVWLVLTIGLKLVPGPEFNTVVVGLVIISVYVVYVLYWSHPFSRERTGVKAVDEAVERYKKPGERTDGVWAPPMVLNGRRYRNVYYLNPAKNERQWMVLDEEGQVLRDEAAAHVLRDMLRVVLVTAHPSYISARASDYSSTRLWCINR